MASEFQKALLAQKMKREQKIAEQGADPCAVVDMNVSAKRRPLLESNQDGRAKETEPKKPKMSDSEIKRAERRAKLAALTAHLRNCEDADKGNEPTNNSVMEPVSTATHVSQTRLPAADNIPAPKTPSKHSKWAQLAAERAIWDNDELQQTPSKAPKPDIAAVQKTSNLPVFQNLRTPDVPKASSAKDQVQAALQKSGKKTTTIVPKAKHQKAKFFEDRIDSLVAQKPKETPKPIKLVETPISTRLEPEPAPAPVLSKNESLLELNKVRKVNRLIANFQSPHSARTPDQRNLPPVLLETRESFAADSDESMDVDKTPPAEPESHDLSDSLQTEPSTVVPAREVEEMLPEPNLPVQAPETSGSSDTGSFNSSENNESLLIAKIEPFSQNGTPMQSTRISDNIESFHMDDSASEDFTIENTEDGTVGNVTGYKRGHSMSFVNKQFDFLAESKSSLKSALSTRRERDEILEDVAEKSYYEEGDIISPKAKNKRRSNTVAYDDTSIIEFNPKSIASFRKTQRVKNYEARATVSSVFQEVENEVVAVDVTKRKRELEEIISKQMNIIRQTSAALSVCTDLKHGKGTKTQVAAEACLLEASRRYEAAKSGLDKLKTEKGLSVGVLEIGDIHLRTRYQETFQSPQHLNSTHWIMAVVQVDEQVHVTAVKEIKNIREQKSVVLNSRCKFKNVRQDFVIDVAIYSMSTKMPKVEPKSRQLAGGSIFKKLGFKKSTSSDKMPSNPAMMSAGGPNAVRNSNFRSVGSASITMDTAQSYEQYKLRTTWDSLIQSVFAMPVEMKFTKSVAFSTFLTVRKGGDSHYGDWRRYWAVLSRDRITFWKYPEDQDDLPQEGYISLRYALNEEVKTANRAMTSRPNCFELYCAPLAPDQKRNPTHLEGIVSSYDPNKFQRYIFSADNAEQKKEWCKALKSTLDKLRVWHKDLPAPVPDSLGQ